MRLHELPYSQDQRQHVKTEVEVLLMLAVGLLSPQSEI